VNTEVATRKQAARKGHRRTLAIPLRRPTPDLRLSSVAGPAFVLVLLLAWEALSQLKLVNVLLFPPVTSILGRFFALWADNTFVANMVPTLRRMLVGYALAAAVGISLGTLMGYWSGVYNRLTPLLEFLRPLPPVAVIPVFVLFLGIGDEMKIASVLFGAVWPVLLNTVDGVRGVHPTIVDVARMYQFKTIRTLRSVILPAAMPQIMAGLRTALAISLIVALVSEMIGATEGLGLFIVLSQRSFRQTDMYAGVFLLAVLGYSLNRAFLLIESRLMAWHLERGQQSA
jgi:ABC-type nitrate/sulfonate/bicarbonate transport system permease component